jgi:hypothetical protein
MASLVIMLIYALTTTSQYRWFPKSGPKGDIRPGDPAICHLDATISFDITSDETTDIQRVVLSIIFLAFSMVNRIQQLYHAPTIVALNARGWASNRAKKLLEGSYRRCSSGTKTACAEAILVYRPLLALFLTLRLLLDVFMSKALDVRDNIRI